MSDHDLHNDWRMKKLLRSILPKEGITVAIFGNSKLVRKGWNQFEIHGGSPEDQEEAYEWMSLFLHGVNVHEFPADKSSSH